MQQTVNPDTQVEDSNSEPVSFSGQGTDKNVAAPTETVVYHTVKKGENLYRISLKYYHSKAGEEVIRKANNLKGNEIYLGQVLEIPLTK
ncbi:LysM peptidoglycan-binding domain-containing protein [Neobacillus vireti]|uniref:LysM peptidoglycan-binding domain-containing protein n=1 Tax=Neobacillus vireti TaxID=220686 RepID=UPI002FFFD9B5